AGVEARAHALRRAEVGPAAGRHGLEAEARLAPLQDRAREVERLELGVHRGDALRPAFPAARQRAGERFHESGQALPVALEQARAARGEEEAVPQRAPGEELGRLAGA